MSTTRQSTCVELTGRLTVGSVAAGREELLSLLEANQAVIVRIDANCDVDVAGIQLLVAARAYARSKSVSLTLAAPATGTLLDVLRRGGFVEDASQDDRQFWLHGETV